jgi:biopolymer transport protein ExbD
MAIQDYLIDDDTAPMAEINTTPLVDVMLVLFVLFMVTAPMLTQGIKLELPTTSAPQMTDKSAISVAISSQGKYYWNDVVLSAHELDQRFETIAATSPQQPIHLHIDARVEYGTVSQVLSLTQKHNLREIGFVTLPKN